MFKLFYDIINGRFQPHLITDENLIQLKELYYNNIYYDDEGEILNRTDEWYDLCLGEGRKIQIFINKNAIINKDIIYKFKPDSSIVKTYNFFLPSPPGQMTEIYLTLIEREVLLIKHKVITHSSDVENIKNYAGENITILHELAQQLSKYISVICKEIDDKILKNEILYVLNILKFYIIDLTQFIQKSFSSEYEYSFTLSTKLFNESFPSFPDLIFSLLPKEKEFDDFKKEFIAKNKQRIVNYKLYGVLSIGESLFQHYKSRCINISIKSQLEKYHGIIHYWKQLLITNKPSYMLQAYMPEIENILLPLIREEIDFLEKKIKIDSLVNVSAFQNIQNNTTHSLIETNQTTIPELDKSKKESEQKIPVNIFCPKMGLDIPKKHFKVFTENLSKNGKPFLTEEQLNNFIKRAFSGNKNIPKLKFNNGSKQRSLIQWEFYDFYFNNCETFFYTMQRQSDFIKILTENFEGWEYKKVQSNFKPKTKSRLKRSGKY